MQRFEARGFPTIPWDPEPRPADPDDPTDEEHDAWFAWFDRHHDELKPWMCACAYEDDELPDLPPWRSFLSRMWHRVQRWFERPVKWVEVEVPPVDLADLRRRFLESGVQLPARHPGRDKSPRR
jgi:hypothetical protein